MSPHIWNGGEEIFVARLLSSVEKTLDQPKQSVFIGGLNDSEYVPCYAHNRICFMVVGIAETIQFTLEQAKSFMSALKAGDKGARPMIAAPDVRAFVSPIACAALATAGSGDVLCGMVGALLAGGADPLAAAQVAVFVHGLAGEALSVDLGDGVAAGDLPIAIASVIARLQHRGEDRRAVTPSAAARSERAAKRAPRTGQKGAPRPRRPSSSTPRRRSRS